MEKRVKILVFSDYFSPAYKAGGPIRSLFNLIISTNDKVEYAVISRNIDIDRTLLDSKDCQKIDVFIKNIFYTEGFINFFNTLRKITTKYDFDHFYVNSVFSLQFTFLPVLFLRLFYQKTHLIFATRGELSVNALGTSKNLKAFLKRLYIFILCRLLSKSHTTFQASSDFEKLDILRNFPQFKVKISSDFPDLTLPFIEKKLNDSGVFRVIWAARISPIKNLHLLLEYLREVDFEFRIDVFGVAEDKNYWDKCYEISQNTNLVDRVKFFGPQSYQELVSKLCEYDLFISMSGSENFGHSIVEALFSGIPVLIGFNTPWQELSTYQAGFNVNPMNKEEFLDAFRASFNIFSNTELRYAWRKGARQYIINHQLFTNLHKDFYELMDRYN